MTTPSRRHWQHPVFIDLTDHPVVVVGGGTVAARKIQTLMESGARVTVVSPEVVGAIAQMADAGRLTLRRRPYQQGDLDGFRLAYAATSDREVNRAVREEARAAGIWLNAIDQPDLCEFITPAIVRRGNLTIAVSTNGRCPELASHIRQDLEHQFGPEYADAVEQLGEVRDRTKAATGSTADLEAAVAEVLAALPSRSLRPHSTCAAPRVTAGTAYLVGAGPGDPELLTIKGRRLLECADTVVYDALVDPRLLELCPPSARRLFVGKRSRHHTRTQDEINHLLIEEAQAGRIVVRLKGGDPFVFGRGGEEAQALVAAGVPFEVVPGVSAGVGVPAYSGIPVTHRDVTSEVVFLSGHESASDRAPIEWHHYGRSSATLVIFMGLTALGTIARELIHHGRDARCPVAVIANGTTASQRTVVATLGDIAPAVEEADLPSPALVVVGEVVALRDTLNWFDPAPGVTRPKDG